LSQASQRLHYERASFSQGKVRIAGIDEAGRGPLAGPVVAAAVVISKEFLESAFQESLSDNDLLFLEINDSKKLTPKKREKLYSYIIEHPQISATWSVISAEVIDRVNILNATYMAMQESVEKLDPAPDHLFVDGHPLPERFFPQAKQGLTQEGIVKGDGLSLSIGAASIIAKVHRDRMMLEYDLNFPQYGFSSHKGYGTREHIAKIKEHGPSPIHRKSFAPIALRRMVRNPN